MPDVVRKDLATILQRMVQVIPARSPSEIMRNVRLVFSEGKLTAYGTDGDIGVFMKIDCPEMGEEAIICTDAAKLREIASASKREVLTFQETAKGMKLTDSKATYSICTADPQLLPSMPTVEGTKLFVEGQEFRAAIEDVIHAIDRASARYALDSVALIFKAVDTLQVAATDGRRCALVDVRADFQGVLDKALLPSRAAALVQSLLTAGNTEITINANLISVKQDGFEIIARQVEGRFPNVTSVMPQTISCDITVNCAEMLESIRQASLVLNESRAIEIDFQSRVIVAKDETANANVAIESMISTNTNVVTIDHGFLRDCLRKSGVVTMMCDGSMLYIQKAPQSREVIMLMAK